MEAMEGAARSVSTSSVKERIVVLRGLESMIQYSDGKGDFASELVDVVFATLHLYTDRASQLAVESVIVKALGEPAFVKAFTGQLVQTAERNLKSGTASVDLKLFRWACLLVRNSPTVVSSRNAFGRLASVQSYLFCSLLGRSRRQQESARSQFFRLLREVKNLYDSYLFELQASVSDKSAGLIALLLDYSGMDNSLFEKHKGFFLDLYIKLVLGSRERPSFALSESFHVLFKHLSHDEFGKMVVPAVVKMLRRNPEIVMEAVGILFKLTPLDPSRYIPEVLPLVLLQARHSDDSRRKEALAIVSCIAHGDLSTVYESIKSILGGSEGKLGSVYQKVGLLNAIQAISGAAKGKAVSSLAGSVSSFLTTYYKEDGNEDVRLSILAALGPWLAKAQDKMQADCLSFFIPGLKEKENLRRAHLRCLRQASVNEDIPMRMQALVDPLMQLAKAGITKPAQKLDAIYSLLLLLKIAAADMRTEDKLVKEKIFPSVLQNDSTFLNASLISKLQLDDCAALVELLELLAQHQLSRSEYGEQSHQIYQLLVTLLWHSTWDVRRSAAAAVGRLQKASISIAEELLKSFAGCLPSLQDQIALSNRSSVENGADNLIDIPSGGLLAKALGVLGFPPLVRNPAFCTQLLIFYVHECVCRGSRTRHFWKDFVKHCGRQGLDIASILKSDSSAVRKVLTGHNGLDSPHSSVSRAATFAFGEAVRLIPTEFFPHVFQVLESLADWSTHDGLTEHDILVFKTPEGVLSSEGTVYIPEVVADRNVKQAKGRFKMYDDAPPGKDSKLRVTSRPSLQNNANNKMPKKSVESKTAKEEARELLLKEEANTRLKVRHVKERFLMLLSIIEAVAAENPDIVHKQLPVLTPLVFRLLKSPIVSQEAFRAMTKLAGCITPPLRGAAVDLAAAVNIVATDPSVISAELNSSEKGVISRVVRAVANACGHGPLPAQSFEFLFPVIQQVLLLPKKTDLHDDLLRVLSMHSSPWLRVPRSKMISVLYHVLGLLPTHLSSINPVLVELCRGIEAKDLPEALAGVYSKHAHVRVACLEAAASIPILAKRAAPFNPVVASALWTAMHDEEKLVADAAEEVWDLYDHELGNDYAAGLLGLLSHVHVNVRKAAAAALAAAMEDYPSSIQETLSALFTLYTRDLPINGNEDPTWSGRQGVALALEAAAGVLTLKDLPVVTTFLISRALADRTADVRYMMVQAGIAIIDNLGKDSTGLLLPIFENYLNKKAADEETYDLVREGVVIFLGALAKHLAEDDPKVTVILDKLLEVLKTPSESVQRAVSNCLPPLMQMKQVDAANVAKRLLHELLDSDKFAERYGAAFGLAGVAKGVGISCLKKFGIMDTLIAAIQNKNLAKAREGALLAFECLSEKLGRLFEPYVIRILPELLVCFSDPVVAVREATDGAARTIMSQLTGPGVKLVLPALLKGLEDKAWRTKQGSVQLLGAMAFCAPRQLSQCLPTIVPKLGEVLTDTHPKVQAAAQTALQQVGSVIKNPEIAALVPLLLIGIAQPNEHTKSSLDALLQTTFVNTVDAPSLALLVPIVHRGLRERSTEAKKKAAQIVGNMCSLVTDFKDMLPYLSLLLPEVKKVLVDPIPEVRTVAARALGSLIKGMGDENFPDLVPWLLETLKSENSGVERSGAAQGLSDVLAALGTDYFEQLLPEIIQNCSHPRASVRDGYLTLFKYLPSSLGSTFQTYLPRVLPAILDGLADENESVRDAALSAGHVFVEHYATSSLPLLLPAVEEGIFHDSWRIRQSSVELLGDLLFKVAGTSGKVVLEGGSDDEGASTEAHGRAIMDILGTQRRNEILAALYTVRSDVSLTVRQAALHVWKTVVANTPKTLKEIMPVLMSTLISSLASPSSERRQVAGRSLGELVRKLGDRVLPSIIPILSQGLQDEDGGTRQGVCMGLSEVMGSAGKQQLMTYMGDLIPTIRTALCDNLVEVREAAGVAFSTLYKNSGMQAIDEIVPSLLSALEDGETSRTALDGLKQILSVRTAAVLPHILPKLVQPPLTAFNAHALGALAEVAGPGLNGHLGIILPPLISSMDSNDTEISALARAAAETVLVAVDTEGKDLLLAELVRGLNESQASVRAGSAYLIGFFFKHTKIDLSEEVSNLLTTLIIMLTDSNEQVVKAAWEALVNVAGTISKENQLSYVKVVRDAVSTARDKERRKRKGGPVYIPGFCLPKGLQPVLPIFLQGLMSGSAELREQAAEGLGELVNVTNEAALKPFVVPITGPLIRIIGDRFPWQVKSAILATLRIIISKGGTSLKPFLPQLQTTFLKCLQDNTRVVRSRAAFALGKLTSLSTRVEPLVGDLLVAFSSAEGGVKEAILIALKGVVKNAGKSLSPAIMDRIAASLKDLLLDEEDQIRILTAKTIGLVSQHLSEDNFPNMVQLVITPGTTWTSRHGFALALASILRHSGDRVRTSSTLFSATISVLKSRTNDDKAPVREATAKAIGRLLANDDAGKSLTELLPCVVTLLSDSTGDVRRAALSSLKMVAKANAENLALYLAMVGPAVAECVKDSSSPVRVAAERCAFYLFQLYRGSESLQLAQKFLTGLEARRIAKQQLEQSDESDRSDDEEP